MQPDFTKLKSVGATPNFASLKPVTQPQSTASSGGFVADTLKTLLVKPAARFAETIGRTGILGETIKTGYEDMSSQAQDIRFPGRKSFGVIEPQKSFGQGGATQIFSDALKSGTYLAPYGKLAGAGSKIATAVGAGEKLARVAGGVTAGAIGGYTTDVSQNLDEAKKMTIDAFTPGFATILGGATGGLLEGAGLGLEKLTGGAKELSKELEQQTFKLTPAQKTKLGSKLDDITKFSTENIPSGSPDKRFSYADDLYEHYEEQLQKALQEKVSIAGGRTDISKFTVNRNDFIKQLESIKSEYQYDRDFGAINKQIDGAINTIKSQYPNGIIPVDKLNIFKRSTYKNAYNQAGDKVLDTVEHEIGDRARVAIEKATEGLEVGGKTVGEFNKEYGNLIQLRKILKLAQNRPELGFTKRITARIIGGIVGTALGGIPGLIGGELVAEPIASGLAGTAAKGGLSKKLMNVKPVTGSVIQRLYSNSSPKANPTISNKIPISANNALNKGSAQAGLLTTGAIAGATALSTISNTDEYTKIEQVPNEIPKENLANALMQLESSGGTDTANADKGEVKWLVGLTKVAIDELKRVGEIKSIDVNDKKQVVDAAVKYFNLMKKRFPDLTPAEIYVDKYWTQWKHAKNPQLARQQKIDKFNELIK